MTVYLVGAGPGDPDLLTLRAARLLGEADVVVHDRLVGPQVLDMIAPWAERIDVGKDPDGIRTTQDRINELLVDRGRRHETVVRLKGGDPFVFGRGGEEAVALGAAGVAVQVVPGITSAIAGPATAGVPVTHRGLSSAFTVVTAHQDPNGEQDLDWDALARIGSTLVILMGARRAASVRHRLLAAGMAADTPVTIVVSATTPQQRTFRLRLDALGATTVPNPAVIVVGAVAANDVLAAMPDPTPTGPATAAATATATAGPDRSPDTDNRRDHRAAVAALEGVAPWP